VDFLLYICNVRNQQIKINLKGEEMKDLISSIKFYIFLVIIMYLMFSFVLANVNFLYWSETARYFFVSFILTISIGANTFYYLHNSTKK